MATEEEVAALAEAVWQVLDDMAVDGRSCCGAAKAQLRIAYEPFRQDDYADWMPLDAAKAIIDDINRR